MVRDGLNILPHPRLSETKELFDVTLAQEMMTVLRGEEKSVLPVLSF